MGASPSFGELLGDSRCFRGFFLRAGARHARAEPRRRNDDEHLHRGQKSIQAITLCRPLDHGHDGLRLALVGDRRGLGLLQLRRNAIAAAGVAAIVELAEDHLAGGGLQHRRHRDVDVLADHLARVVDDHHGAVVEISDALVVFLAFFQDEDLHDLAGQHDGLERIRQLIDVQHLDALQLRDLIQVEVVGDDLGPS